MVNVEHTLFGWTPEQWAIAKARLGCTDVSLRGANELKKRWDMSNPAVPGEIRFEGIDTPRDWAFSAELFCAVATSGLHPAALT